MESPWNFKCKVMLHFDDDSVFEKEFGRTTLDQDANQANFSL